MNKERQNKHKVILIGSGPGDPELITVKGVRYLQEANVVIFDYLASEKLLRHCKPHVETIYVGKQAGAHTLSQSKINQLLIDKAREGHLVVRLKGGDPFVFGRGGEEVLALADAGIDFEVVPGITAGTAALTYAGIPATHRGTATSISFITGHEDPNKKESDLNWDAIANMNGTLVFYMGVKNLPEITRQLLSHGRSADTPVALIRWGTLPSQQTLIGTLGTISEKAKEANFRPPALIVVGEVIRHRDKMNWFESKPLFGNRIVITRARAQSSDFEHQLTTLGAQVIEFPTIRIEPPASWNNLDNAIDKLDDYHWVVFTSVNGVAYFHQRMLAKGKDLRQLNGVNIAAIGPATSEKLQQLGIFPDIQPEKFVAESLIESLKKKAELSGTHFLLPRAMGARPLLKNELEKYGAVVDEVGAYVTIVETDHREEVLKRIRDGEIDLITFTSSSTVKNFVKIIGEENIHSLKHVAIACIGPITQKTASEYGLNCHIMPEAYTIPAMVEEIVKYFVPYEMHQRGWCIGR